MSIINSFDHGELNATLFHTQRIRKSLCPFDLLPHHREPDMHSYNVTAHCRIDKLLISWQIISAHGENPQNRRTIA